MPRNAVVSRHPATVVPVSSSASAALPVQTHAVISDPAVAASDTGHAHATRRNADESAAAGPEQAARHIAVTLSHPHSVTAWDGLVERCGSAQAALEALVLLPAAMRGAGLDPDSYLIAWSLRGKA